MKPKSLFTLSLDIGEQMIRNGGEIYRTEDTIRRINAAYGNECSVFALPSLLLAQCEGELAVRRITRGDIDLAELERLNALSRKLCAGHTDIDVTRQSGSRTVTILSSIAAVFLFCLFFGGSVLDGASAGALALLLCLAPYKRLPLPLFSQNMADAFVTGGAAQLLRLTALPVHADKIMIGAIMLSVPGITISSAMRDLIMGDILAGLFELADALTSTLGIAFGIAGALLLFRL